MLAGNAAPIAAFEQSGCTLTDANLLKQVAARDYSSNSALNELVTRHYAWIHRICVLRLRNVADAEDLTQDVFMRVNKYAKQFENRSAVRTWLYKIAQNQCNTYLNKKTQSKFECIDNYSDLLSDSQAEAKHKRRELASTIHYVLSKMTKQCQEVITLRFFHEMSIQQIAKKLNLGLSATKMRLYRALEQFKLIYVEEINA